MVRTLHSNVVPLELELHRIKRLAQDCEVANIEENDHTVHSYDDLEYEYGLAKESVTKKLGFLENQVRRAAPARARAAADPPDCRAQHDEPHANTARGVGERVPPL